MILFYQMYHMWVDVCNRFACLLVEPTPDDCADPTIRSDSPDSSCVNSLHLSYPLLYPSVPIQARFPVPMTLTLLFWWFPRLRMVVTSLSRNFVSHQCRQSRHSPLLRCLQMMLAQEFVRLWLLLMA